MLCLPGLTPVWNVDQATGEIGGTVVPSGLKQPWSRSAARWGSLPSSSIFSVRPWSMPSRPRITTRLTRLRRSARQPKSVRDSRRTGQVMNVQKRREDRGEDREERAGQREARPRARCRRGPGSGPGATRSTSQEQQPRVLAHLTHFFAVSCDFFASFAFFGSLPALRSVLPGFRSLPARPGIVGTVPIGAEERIPHDRTAGPRGGPPGPPGRPGGPALPGRSAGRRPAGERAAAAEVRPASP